MLNNLAKPVQFARLVAPTANVLTRTIGRARCGTAMAAPLTAPRTSFNGMISGQRTDRVRRHLPGEDQGDRHAVDGATVNDVVISLCGGALRRYLEERDELPETSLLASVPVSVHQTSKKSGGSNKVSSMFAQLGTDVADPVKRLKQLSEANAQRQGPPQGDPGGHTAGLGRVRRSADLRARGPGRRQARLAEKGPVIHNLVISNVPGPPVPLYFMGAKIEGFYPLGPIFHGAGLNITVMSTNGQMHVG